MRKSWILAVASATLVVASNSPTVDLGYAIHQATINVSFLSQVDARGFADQRYRVAMPQDQINFCLTCTISANLLHQKETGQYYNFSNIPFAAPPIGNLRFSAPVPPRGRNTTINTGQTTHICPQSDPAWILTAEQFLSGVPLATLINESSSSTPSLADLPTPDPRTSEDCLLLDVMVPVNIFSNQTRKQKNGRKQGCKGGQYYHLHSKLSSDSLLTSNSSCDGVDLRWR